MGASPKSAIPARKRFSYQPPAAFGRPEPEELEVLVVGGGPVGLTAALDLAQRGHRVVVLNRLGIVADGSKAICLSKRTLDIYQRLGIAGQMLERGVAWDVGKVFWGARPEPIYQFSMQPVAEQQSPGFINLQQYHLEAYLLEALAAQPNVEIRWLNELTGLECYPDHVLATVRTPDGEYRIRASYLLACDGHRSTVRTLMSLDFEGRVFEDNFLIADVSFDQPRPAERWFWFEPPFPGQSALLHKQPDGIWRLDFQLGAGVDRAEAAKPENVAPFVEGLLGKGVPYRLEWLSVYTFQCRRMARFAHGRVLFAGDAAHLVSPFGARGCNSGVADADNLVWKLDLVLRGAALPALLASYDEEMVHAADVNILNSTRATDFITPKAASSRALRDAVLELATVHPFARPFVNSGRLATAVPLPHSSLNTADADVWEHGIAPGWPALDAPLADTDGAPCWLLQQLRGRFVLLVFASDAREIEAVTAWSAAQPELSRAIPLFVGGDGTLQDLRGLAVARYGAAPRALYLVRPDQYVAARWRRFEPLEVEVALRRARGIWSAAPGDAQCH